MSIIYYIADEAKRRFAYIKQYPSEPFARHTLYLSTSEVEPFATLQKCLVTWYTPLDFSNISATSSRQLPYLDMGLQSRTDMYVYKHTLSTNLIQRAALPVIRQRSFSKLPNVEDLADEEYFVHTKILLDSAVIYKKQTNILNSIHITNILTFI